MKKKKLILLVLVCALTAAALTCFLICRALASGLDSQTAAERWAGESEMPFAQLSCFMGSKDNIAPGNIYAFRQSLEKKLTEASLEAPADTRLYSDAWSAVGDVRVTGDHGSSDAAVTAVGGSFFRFHPLRLLSGSYISEEDMMDDRVVLDRELAWRLFGGEELEGMTVTLGADPRPYVIAGVVEREQDFASKKAHAGGMGLYMSFRAYSALSAGGSGGASGSGGAVIDCYELVMPQPVKGFAEGIVKEGLGLQDGEVLNNTGRFGVPALWSILRSFGSRSMHLTNVRYPYWENAARCVEDWCVLFFALALVFAAIPALMAAGMGLVGLIRLKDYLGKKLPALASDTVERHRRKRWQGGAHLKR